MTEYSSGSSITLPGFLSTAHGGADATVAKDGTHAVQLKYPYHLNRVQSTNVALQVVVSHTGSGTGTDINFQVSTTADFASPVSDLSLLNSPDGYVGTTVIGLIDQTRYYWRARASRAGTGEWGDWTPVLEFIVDTATGRGYAESRYNVGLSWLSSSESVHVSHSNFGLEYFPQSRVIHVSDVNVGLEIFLKSVGFHDVHEGDVSTNTPTPHLWFLSPAAGRSGDGLKLYCFGVGDLQSTFDGIVEIDWGEPDGWKAVQTTGWQTFPPTVEAYTANRMLDEELEHIDMQHTVIEFTVPDGAIPPGYPIRIRTNGP